MPPLFPHNCILNLTLIPIYYVIDFLLLEPIEIVISS